jgi:hypothetical protein
MSVKLITSSVEHAKKLVKNRQCVPDQRDDWSEHRPSRTAENKFIQEHGISGYRKWHLGEDDELPDDNKHRYKFPYGDFHKVHRCAVVTAESRAGQYKYLDIELAAAHLHGMLDELMPEDSPAVRVRRVHSR